MNINEEMVYNESTNMKKFIDNMNRRNPCSNMQMHNIYLLQTTDLDGNVTGEKYAINLMTDYGVRQIFVNKQYYSSYQSIGIFIGDGTDMPKTDNPYLYSPIINDHTIESDTKLYAGTMSYDKTTGMISGRRQMYQGYFDYVIDSLPEPREITEIGFGYYMSAYVNQPNLYTHARIYDIDGNLSSIVKKPNERLTITMIWSVSFHEDLIQNAYDNGLYMFMNPSFFADNEIGYTYDFISVECICMHNHYYSNRTDDAYWYIYTSPMLSNATFDPSTNVLESTTSYNESFLLQSDTDYMSYFLYTYCDNYERGTFGGFQTKYWFVIKHEKLPEPEEIVFDSVYTNSYDTLQVDNMFGLKKDTSDYPSTLDGFIPVSDFDIKAMYMYNHTTKDWEIEELFVNNPNADYTSTTIKICGCTWINFNGSDVYVYVYVNANPDIPITGVTNTGITLYATDKYWDPDTWQLITSLNNIPPELQKKRYFVQTDGEASYIYPIRDMTRHSIDVPKTKYKLTAVSGTNISTIRNESYSSDENGWILALYNLIYPQDDGNDISYRIYSTDNSNPHPSNRWATDDRILVMPENMPNGSISNNSFDYISRNIRIYTVGKDPNIEPTYVDLELEFNDNLITALNYCSFSTNGYLAIQRVQGDENEAVIIDLYGSEDGTPTQYLLNNTKYCHVLNPTNNCVYLVPDSHPATFEIYDMNERKVIRSFSLSEEYTFAGISGWKDFIYVRVQSSGTYSTFLYNMNTDTLVHLPSLNLPTMEIPEISFNGSIARYRDSKILSVDECMIVGCIYFNISGGDYVPYYCRLFSESDPEHPTMLYTDQSNSAHSYFPHYIINGQLKYINDGKQLLMTSNFQRMYVVDIGYILDNGPLKLYPYKHYEYFSDGYTNHMLNSISGFFKNGVYRIDRKNDGVITWYPIESLLPHKMVGTTRTIQSFNNPKKFAPRPLKFTFTNKTT